MPCKAILNLDFSLMRLAALCLPVIASLANFACARFGPSYVGFWHKPSANWRFVRPRFLSPKQERLVGCLELKQASYQSRGPYVLKTRAAVSNRHAHLYFQKRTLPLFHPGTLVQNGAAAPADFVCLACCNSLISYQQLWQ
jgi:hypothetical protein